MSRMLNFYEAVWATARQQALQGRSVEALASLQPVLVGMDAPERLRVLAHRLAGRLLFNQADFRRSRKHLRIALRLEPHHADTIYDLGRSWDYDSFGSDRYALIYYRKALRLKAKSPRFMAAYGRALVRNDRAALGVKHLIRAFKLAPKEAFVVRAVVEGLLDAQQFRRAERVLQQAQFHSPRSEPIKALAKEMRFKFRQVQQRANRDEPAILTFPGVNGSVYRRDVPSGPPVLRPHLRLGHSHQG
jgi:Flp pilus assembly protein TadD